MLLKEISKDYFDFQGIGDVAQAINYTGNIFSWN